MRTVVYPGSFDPCTNGHIDIISRASRLFDRVIVAVLINNSKSPLFTAGERVEMLKTAVADYSNVEVFSFDGLLVDFMKAVKADIIIKGIRAVSDFEYEFQQALINKELNNEVETVFITTRAENMYLSSSVVKHICSLGGDISTFVPPEICDVIVERIRKEDVK